MDKQSEQQELKDIIATREDGFGYRFKITRVEKKLSIDDVSRELHLSKKIILALESEDYTQLPVAAFVCGYIRNYSKLLKIQPEPLLEYYKNNRSENALDPELKIIKGKEAPGSSIAASTLSVIVKPLLSLLIILILAAVGWKLWVYVSSNFLDNTNGQSIDAETMNLGIETDIEKINDDANVLLLPKLDNSYDPPEEEMIESVGEKAQIQSSPLVPLEDSVISQDEGSLSAEDSLQAEGSSLSKPADGSSQADGSLSADGSMLAEGSPTSEIPSPVAEPALAVDNQLVLEFSGNSWVSIKDANNKILATGLKKSSKTLKLKGKMPYKVFLGDARVVKVSLNGKVFDHAKYINEKNIARFNVK